MLFIVEKGVVESVFLMICFFISVSMFLIYIYIRKLLRYFALPKHLISIFRQSISHCCISEHLSFFLNLEIHFVLVFLSCPIHFLQILEVHTPEAYQYAAHFQLCCWEVQSPYTFYLHRKIHLISSLITTVCLLICFWIYVGFQCGQRHVLPFVSARLI